LEALASYGQLLDNGTGAQPFRKLRRFQKFAIADEKATLVSAADYLP